MKKFLLGCAVAMFGLISSASAQECYPYSYDCGTPCCSNEFNGFYVGGNLGVISNNAHRTDFDGFLFSGVPTSYSFNNTSFTAGVGVGYDMACSSKLVGLVWDWNWTNNNRSLNPY